MIWQVDVYEGALSGVTLAELELDSEDQPFSKPDWIGMEVTGDPRFKKAALLRLKERFGQPLTVAAVLAA